MGGHMVPEMIKRVYIGQGVDEAMEMPSLIDIQLSSFERFLQREKLREGKPTQRQGLEDVFQAIFPIESPNGDMVL
jgi:DNA-directed RNA polymerase subunit beta